MIRMDRACDPELGSDLSESEDSGTSGDEVPVWVRGEQRWISGVGHDTTCADFKAALLQDEATKVKISLRRVSSDERISNRRRRNRADSSCSWNSKHSSHTLHPRRLYTLVTSDQKKQLPSGDTEDLLKLVLAQGEIIRKQLRRLRHSENQIGFLEDKTHRARVRKHGSNYLLETYLKGLPDAMETSGASPSGDKNSDSGVMTEGDSGEATTSTQNPYDRLSPAYSDGKDEENSANEELLKDTANALDTMSKLNKRLLKEEEKLVRLHISIKKYERNKNDYEQIHESLTELRSDMAKSACEMQHNAIVLDETTELLDARRLYLSELQKELSVAEQEHDMLSTMKLSQDVKARKQPTNSYIHHYSPYTKELNTLV